MELRPTAWNLTTLFSWSLSGAVLYYLFCSLLIGSLLSTAYEPHPETIQEAFDMGYKVFWTGVEAAKERVSHGDITT